MATVAENVGEVQNPDKRGRPYRTHQAPRAVYRCTLPPTLPLLAILPRMRPQSSFTAKNAFLDASNRNHGSAETQPRRGSRPVHSASRGRTTRAALVGRFGGRPRPDFPSPRAGDGLFDGANRRDGSRSRPSIRVHAAPECRPVRKSSAAPVPNHPASWLRFDAN